MATSTRISLEEYFRTHYEPECELIDGELAAGVVFESRRMWLQRRRTAGDMLARRDVSQLGRLPARGAVAKKRPPRWITIGSLLAAVCWIGATTGFGAYISTVSYSSFYGGLGSVILLLIYLHVSAIAFLLGVTVDSSLREEVSRETNTRRRGRARRRAGT